MTAFDILLFLFCLLCPAFNLYVLHLNDQLQRRLDYKEARLIKARFEIATLRATISDLTTVQYESLGEWLDRTDYDLSHTEPIDT